MGRRLPSLRTPTERNALVLANLNLVPHICKLLLPRLSPYASPHVDIEDVLQDGRVGLMRAADLWDGSRGLQFSTYASRAIISYVLRGRRRAEAVAVPDHFRGEERKALRKAVNMVSLNARRRFHSERDGEREVGDVVAAKQAPEPPDRSDVEVLLKRCQTRDRRDVLWWRACGETLAQIAQRMGLSRERVRQIERAAVEDCRRAEGE